uniref:CUB_2 domain-containing protein n=1 Tax=Caenorhabditis tropicalis TaxID=1561998 RepID=A0A1I7UBH7_9PELO
MDTAIVLNQIFLKTADNQMQTLQDLKHSKVSNSSGQLIPMKIQSTAYISSSLADTQMAALEGFLYITTEKQSSNYMFKVFDVDQSQMIRTSLLICDPCTIVLLNSNGQMTPPLSSTISFWRQSPDSEVYMYKGVPTDDQESDDSQIFSNPMISFMNRQIRFPIIEKFSVSLGAFYFKTTSDFYFAIQPSYFDLEQYTTTGYTTTGFYMKSRDQVPKNVTFFCVKDSRYNGTTGAQFLGSLPDYNGTVIVKEEDSKQSESIKIHPIGKMNKWSTNSIGDTLSISSVKSEGGEFFVQYHIQQDQEISSTFAPTGAVSKTTGSVETTTKVSRGVSGLFILVLVSLIF